MVYSNPDFRDATLGLVWQNNAFLNPKCENALFLLKKRPIKVLIQRTRRTPGGGFNMSFGVHQSAATSPGERIAIKLVELCKKLSVVGNEGFFPSRVTNKKEVRREPC